MKINIKLSIIILAMLFIILISGCITDTKKAPKAIFDMGHGEIFSPDDGTPSSYTGFYYQFYEKGFDMAINDQTINSGSLAGADVLIAAGPMREFGASEIKDITNFVEDGGSLLILTHISSPVNPLAQEFGISVSGNVTAEGENQIKSSPQDFFVMDLEKHNITNEIKKIAVYGTWSVKVKEPGRIVAWTSDSAWSDTNRNRKLDTGIERTERLGVVAVTEYGLGKVVVVADDAVFIDMFRSEGDNVQFGDNIINWFKKDYISLN